MTKAIAQTLIAPITRRRAIALALIAFLAGAPADACIFQSHNKSGKSPFWPSSKIEVCFLPPKPQTHISAPNPLDETYQKKYEENAATVRRTLVEQINGRTKFKMTGFQTCQDADRGKPMIRINLNGAGGGGGALAASIGPNSSGEAENITMTTVNAEWSATGKPQKGASTGERVRVFHDQRHISWIALHETLHLLGLHHTEYWDRDMTDSDPDALRVTQVGSQPDQLSMMNREQRNFDAAGIAQLSERDVQCLDLIADRRVKALHPPRELTAPASSRETQPRRNPEGSQQGPR